MVPLQPRKGQSLVSKFSPGPVCVRMVVPCAATVKLPHKLKCVAGQILFKGWFGRSTATLSIVIGTSEVLSKRMAPASNVGGLPEGAPMKVTFESFCQGIGKVEFGRRLSA